MSRRFLFLVLLAFAAVCADAQRYAGFVEDVKNATTDSLMNIDGVEYYMLYVDYEKVHFLSMLSEDREVALIGPAQPCDTLYQDGWICGRLGVEEVRRPLAQMRNDSMLVENKFPALFTRCESVSPCNFKVCDTNNFGYKILIDYPKAMGGEWDYLRYWIINYVDSFTNMDMMYYDDVYLEKNIDQSMLPTEMIRKEHPEAFEIENVADGQAVVDHFRDMYMRQVYYLKNLDFSFPLSYLRLFMSPRFVSDRYVTFFISTDFFAYGAHDFPLERYVTFDMKRLEVVKAKTLFRDAVQEEVRGILAEEMERQGFRLGDMDMPQPAIFGDDVVFSFQPYQLGAFTDGISHFKISKDKLRRFIVRERLW